MGGLFSVCRRGRTSLADLGVPSEYEWEGLPEEEADAYEEAKEKIIEELKRSTGSEVNVDDGEWIKQISPQSQDTLKSLLLRRAVGLVRVLKPIEEQRHGLRVMEAKGCLSGNYYKTFAYADELCRKEIKAIMDESQVIAPGIPANAIIQTAAQIHMQEKKAEENDGDEDNAFEDVKRGFLSGGSKSVKKAKQVVGGFEVGAEVEAHSLQTKTLNGARGRVKGAKGDRVAVSFPNPIGEKALKPDNLKLVPPGPYVHPDATEAPASQFQVTLHRGQDETLGLKLSHQPPLDQQKAGQESCCLVEGILDDGFVKKHNDEQEASLRIRPGDRILAVVDGSQPEEKRRIFGGNSRLILEVISKGRTPVILIIGRILGLPLRFKVGQQVFASCGAKGWLAGTVVQVWEACANGSQVPYVIRLNDTGEFVFAPKDCDDTIKKGKRRFKPGDTVMVNREGSFKKAKITEVKEEKLRTGYSVKMESDKSVVNFPEDISKFIRPIARFTAGTKVLANVGSEWVAGKIEDIYSPNWVYSVRLDTGNVVYVPEDVDKLVKKQS
eukprot:TRINITY_DN50187_c0_g1_i1.p1 TRINITY_DN50187_c0_g1~~TRINITY_DN50187_c0_g1_i1.p1  ORF type:complete len:553 (+),score=116.68 TRINITY_DN50187_c0_g1_i1:33-1691(+)